MLVNKKVGYLLPPLFFVLYFLLGLGLFDDYGMSWDEELQRRHGQVSANYINDQFEFTKEYIAWEELETYPFRYHGVLFSVTAYILEIYNELESYRHKFMSRHKMVFILFWFGTLFFYWLARRRFGHWSIALLTVLTLIISPRIFADSFYNPKDMIFLPLFIINSFTLFHLIREKRVSTALVLSCAHALATGMLISTRIIGIIIPATTLLFFLFDLINQNFKTKAILKYLVSTIFYIGLSGAFTYIFWPYLWEAPLARFQEVFELMSKFTWEGEVFFHRQWIKGPDIPWYYLPTWMLISIPPVYLLFFIIGAILVSLQFFKNLKQKLFFEDDRSLINLLAAALFLGPLLAVIVRDAVVYDGWRHLFFTYPFFLLIAMTGFQFLWQKRRSIELREKQLAKGAALILAFGMIYTLGFMLIHHPHQNVYFNFFAGKNLETRFDTDYWGISYKQAYEKLNELEPTADSILVAYPSYPAELNHKYLPKHLQNRFVLKEKPEDADYYISNFRHGEWGIKQYKNGKYPYVHEVYSKSVGNAKVFGIYKVQLANEQKEFD